MKKCCLLLTMVVLTLAGWPSQCHAQKPELNPSIQPEALYAPLPRGEMRRFPSYNSIYCSGFISERPIEHGLYIQSGEEGGMRNEFNPGDIVYLSHGAGWIVRPGGEYMILRQLHDPDPVETFVGQHKLIQSLGTYYAEVGRARVNIVNEKTATAQVTHACDSVTVGDVFVPFDVKPAPPLKPSATFDRFAPPSGKTMGMIISGKDFSILLNTGSIAFLNIGTKEGVAVGQYYRVFRNFTGNERLDLYRRVRNNLPEYASGVRLNVRLTPEQMRSMPRDVLGEVLILWVEGKAATALVTFSQKDIVVGDLVELE